MPEAPRATHHARPVAGRPRRSRGPVIAAAAGAIVGALALMPSPASAAVSARTADMNAGGFAGFDQTNASVGALTVTRSRTYEGSGAAHATYDGGGSNGFARGIFNVGWADGDDVHYGGAFYLPSGFRTAIKSQTDLMRHDNYGSGSLTDYGGIALIKSDGKAHLYRLGSYVSGQSGSGSGEDMNVSPAFDLPEGRWFWLEVRQKLSGTNGRAVNQVWIDDQLVSSSTKANSYGRGVTRLRYGLVGIGEGKQTTPLQLWFDRAMVRSSRIGPLGGATSGGGGGAADDAGSGNGSTGSGSTGNGSTGSGSGSSAGGHDAARPDTSNAGRLRIRKARVRNGRLSFRVVAAQPVARTHYRKASQKRFRPYRKSIRLTSKQRRSTQITVRVSFKDKTKRTATLRVRKGRVSVR